MRIRLALLAIALGVLAFACVRVASAQPMPPDPLSDPQASFDSFRALSKIGWPITVLAGVAVAARLLARFAPRFGFLAGKPAAVIAAIAALGASAFDVLALGGSWGSVVASVVFGALALWDSAGKKTKEAGN